jgi:DnaJ-class molecular chaperone
MTADAADQVASKLDALIAAFDIFGNPPPNTSQELSRRFRQLAKQQMPGAQAGEPEAVRQMQFLNAAYELLRPTYR